MVVVVDLGNFECDGGGLEEEEDGDLDEDGGGC